MTIGEVRIAYLKRQMTDGSIRLLMVDGEDVGRFISLGFYTQIEKREFDELKAAGVPTRDICWRPE